LHTLDTELAERLILDNPETSRISYGTDKARAELSFKKLQELSQYKNNLELTQLPTGERIISYVKDVGKLKPLESRVRVQESELNDLETVLHRKVNTQEALELQKKFIEAEKAQLKAETEAKEQTFDEFSDKIFSEEGIVVEGKKRTMEHEGGEWLLKRDGKIIDRAKAESSGLLPEGAKTIRKKFNSLREQYVRENFMKKFEKANEMPLEEQAKAVEEVTSEVERQVAEVEKADPATKSKIAEFLHKMGEAIRNGKDATVGGAKDRWENLSKWWNGLWVKVESYFTKTGLQRPLSYEQQLAKLKSEGKSLSSEYTFHDDSRGFTMYENNMSVHYIYAKDGTITIRERTLT
jgi:hypothetical protein